MFKKLTELFTHKPGDVEVWTCDPLVVALNGTDITYAQKTNIEFTPKDSTDIVGTAIALTPDAKGVIPEITVVTRLYIDAPSPTPDFGRRQGIVLTGTDPLGEPISWYINGAADHFLTESSIEMEYDEETSKELEAEIGNEIKKSNLHTIL